MSELPTGWAEATLADVGDWSSGGTPSRKVPTYYGGKIPWVKTGDLDHGIVEYVDEFLTEEGLKNSAAKMFPKGSLLVAMYGATIGQTGLLGVAAATNQACAALLANGITNDTIPFVWRYLKAIQDDLRAAGQGGAQPNISHSRSLRLIQSASRPCPNSGGSWRRSTTCRPSPAARAIASTMSLASSRSTSRPSSRRHSGAI